MKRTESVGPLVSTKVVSSAATGSELRLMLGDAVGIRQSGSGLTALERRHGSARSDVADFDADDVLRMVDLVGRALQDEHLFLGVRWRVSRQLHVSTTLGADLK